LLEAHKNYTTEQTKNRESQQQI